MSIDGVIRRLALVPSSDRSVNQYASAAGPESSACRIRRGNLRRYLRFMQGCSPTVLMIGEAPSHRGGRLTGIPFLSETLLLSEEEAGGIFGPSRGYRRATSLERRLSTEASATIVWSTIGSLRPLPLLWNAFPFHPFESGNPLSNRTPTPAELRVGETFLTQLMQIFGPALVLAVGNQSARSLDALGIEHTKVRHPSQGGKPMFVQGVRRAFGMENGE